MLSCVVLGNGNAPKTVTTGKSSDYISILWCGSAVGVAIPTYFFAGMRMRSDLELIEGTIQKHVTESVWSNCVSFLNYL